MYTNTWVVRIFWIHDTQILIISKFNKHATTPCSIVTTARQKTPCNSNYCKAKAPCSSSYCKAKKRLAVVTTSRRVLPCSSYYCKALLPCSSKHTTAMQKRLAVVTTARQKRFAVVTTARRFCLALGEPHRLYHSQAYITYVYVWYIQIIIHINK